MSLKREQLVEQKIKALLARKKPRDFYDLYFILRANLLPPMGKKVLPAVLRTLNQVDLSFEKELKFFLPQDQWLVSKDFKQPWPAKSKNLLDF